LGKVSLACFGVLVELVGFAFSGAGLLVLVEGLISLRFFFEPDLYPRLFLLFLFFFVFFLLL
jgi:hypothetical protein